MPHNSPYDAWPRVTEVTEPKALPLPPSSADLPEARAETALRAHVRPPARSGLRTDIEASAVREARYAKLWQQIEAAEAKKQSLPERRKREQLIEAGERAQAARIEHIRRCEADPAYLRACTAPRLEQDMRWFEEDAQDRREIAEFTERVKSNRAAIRSKEKRL